MATKKFTEFSADSAPGLADFLIGYQSDGSAEFRSTIGNLPFAVYQYVNDEYTPVASQALGNTHADVDGSDISFTPKSASSTIIYKYTFTIGRNDKFLAHFKFLVDGSEETAYRKSIHSETAGVMRVTIGGVKASWGTTAKTLKLQARRYSLSYATLLHDSIYWDGATTETLTNALIEVIEIK